MRRRLAGVVILSIVLLFGVVGVAGAKGPGRRLVSKDRSIVEYPGRAGQITYLGPEETVVDGLDSVGPFCNSTGQVIYSADVRLLSWSSPGTGLWYPGYGYAMPAYAMAGPSTPITIDGITLTIDQFCSEFWLMDSVCANDLACTVVWRPVDFEWITFRGWNGKRYSYDLPEYEIQSISVTSNGTLTARALEALAKY